MGVAGHQVAPPATRDGQGGPTGEGTSQGLGGMPGGSAADSTTYDTVDDYIAALNADEDWVAYDSGTNTAAVASVGAFVRTCKGATKDVGAFDALDRSQAENYVFGTSESDALRFDATMADLLAQNGSDYAVFSDYDSSYANAFATDLKSTDDLGSDSPTRQNMYNPLYFVSDKFDGFGAATPAPHWRIRTGINQSDTSLTTELDLALALAANADVADVDFATVWGQAHTTAELSGSSTQNFIAWVEECCQ